MLPIVANFKYDLFLKAFRMGAGLVFVADCLFACRDRRRACHFERHAPASADCHAVGGQCVRVHFRDCAVLLFVGIGWHHSGFDSCVGHDSNHRVVVFV